MQAGLDRIDEVGEAAVFDAVEYAEGVVVLDLVELTESEATLEEVDGASTRTSARVVLLKGLPDDAGFLFFTNYDSRKGQELAGQPRAARDGVDVTVLTCSLGEEGEVIGDRWAGLTADRGDQLGGYRIHELTVALDALGARPPRFLGGAGRWRDSGMAGTAVQQLQNFRINFINGLTVRQQFFIRHDRILQQIVKVRIVAQRRAGCLKNGSFYR